MKTQAKTSLILCDFSNVLLRFSYHGQYLDTQLIEGLTQQKKYSEMYIYSNSPEFILEHYRAHLIPPFTEFISAKATGLSKKEASSYATLATQFAVKTADILFIDDSESNIAAATTAGCRTHLYTAREPLLEMLSS